MERKQELAEEVQPSREAKADAFIKASGKTVHSSDCATSVAPAEEPGPCDCDTPEDVQLDVEAARQIIAELISSAQFYETYERAMAPGVADGWPDIIPAPHTKNGRLYKVVTESLVEKLQLALLRRVSGKGALTQIYELCINPAYGPAETLSRIFAIVKPGPAPVPATPEQQLPCGCKWTRTQKDLTGPIFWNPYNNVTQCHMCGEIYTPDHVATTQGTPEGAK